MTVKKQLVLSFVLLAISLCVLLVCLILTPASEGSSGYAQAPSAYFPAKDQRLKECVFVVDSPTERQMHACSAKFVDQPVYDISGREIILINPEM